MDIHNQIKTLLDRANYHRQQAEKLEQEAFTKQEQLIQDLMRKKNDKLINRTQAISLLWFTTHQALKDWENKLRGTDYLRFENNKILRSQVLRFRDDYYSGKVHHELRKADQRR